MTCSGLLDESSSTWPESALFQIYDNGVALDKIVIGKPGTTGDASNGCVSFYSVTSITADAEHELDLRYIDPGTLAGCVEDAYKEGWNAGIMVWQVGNGFHVPVIRFT